MSDPVVSSLISCEGCGLCCEKAGSQPVEWYEDVPAWLTTEREGIRTMETTGEGTCIAFDVHQRVCTIYEQRPGSCRAFAVGCAKCLRFRNEANETIDTDVYERERIFLRLLDV